MGSQQGKESGAAAKKSRGGMWAAAVLAGVLLAVGLYWGAGRGDAQGRSFQVNGGETRPVLDASQFGTAGATLAYTAAKRYPELLNKVYCYCGCDRPPINHKSLLSCFATPHGST